MLQIIAHYFILNNRYPHASDNLPYYSIRSQLRYQRAKTFQNKKQNLLDFGKEIEEGLDGLHRLKEGNRARLVVKVVTDANGKPHMVIWDKNFIQEFKSTILAILDCTFQVCPDLEEDYLQLLNVMGRKNGMVLFSMITI